MNWTAILGVISGLLPVFSQILSAWNSPAPTLPAISNIVASLSPANIATLEAIGASIFPKLPQTLQAAAAALQVAHPSAISYVQGSLNVLQAAGLISFGAPLATDGVWGPKTTAAAEAAEAKAGITLTGAINDALVTWLGGELAKLG